MSLKTSLLLLSLFAETALAASDLVLLQSPLFFPFEADVRIEEGNSPFVFVGYETNGRRASETWKDAQETQLSLAQERLSNEERTALYKCLYPRIHVSTDLLFLNELLDSEGTPQPFGSFQTRSAITVFDPGYVLVGQKPGQTRVSVAYQVQKEQVPRKLLGLINAGTKARFHIWVLSADAVFEYFQKALIHARFINSMRAQGIAPTQVDLSDLLSLFGAAAAIFRNSSGSLAVTGQDIGSRTDKVTLLLHDERYSAQARYQLLGYLQHWLFTSKRQQSTLKDHLEGHDGVTLIRIMQNALVEMRTAFTPGQRRKADALDQEFTNLLENSDDLSNVEWATSLCEEKKNCEKSTITFPTIFLFQTFLSN